MSASTPDRAGQNGQCRAGQEGADGRRDALHGGLTDHTDTGRTILADLFGDVLRARAPRPRDGGSRCGLVVVHHEVGVSSGQRRGERRCQHAHWLLCAAGTFARMAASRSPDGVAAEQVFFERTASSLSSIATMPIGECHRVQADVVDQSGFLVTRRTSTFMSSRGISVRAALTASGVVDCMGCGTVHGRGKGRLAWLQPGREVTNPSRRPRRPAQTEPTAMNMPVAAATRTRSIRRA